MVSCTTQINLDCEIVSGFPLSFLIILLVGFAILFIIIKVMKKSNDTIKPPPIIEPEKEVIDGFEDIIKTKGAKIKYKSFLMIGMNRIGRIVKWTPYHYDSLVKIKINNKSNDQSELEQIKQLIESKYELKPVKTNFFLYKICGSTLIHYILYFFFGSSVWNIANVRYFLVDQKFIKDKESNDLFIELYAEPMKFYKTIYIFSSKSQEIIQGMVNHLTVKTLLKETVNFIPQMHYFDFRTGKFAGKLREIGDNRNKNWKKRSGNKQDQEAEDIASAESEE